MARKSGSKRSGSNRRASAISPTHSIARPRLLRPLPILAGLHDRRHYEPDRSTKPPAAGKRDATRIQADNRTNSRNGRTTVGLVTTINFRNPRSVHLCRRRKSRRQVIHALGIAGKRGVGEGRRRHVNFWSKVSC